MTKIEINQPCEGWDYNLISEDQLTAIDVNISTIINQEDTGTIDLMRQVPPPDIGKVNGAAVLAIKSIKTSILSPVKAISLQAAREYTAPNSTDYQSDEINVTYNGQYIGLKTTSSARGKNHYFKFAFQYQLSSGNWTAPYSALLVVRVMGNKYK
ncbi:MAG: hypothetical protein AB8B69_07950 [Chitinophagales bacterium]